MLNHNASPFVPAALKLSSENASKALELNDLQWKLTQQAKQYSNELAAANEEKIGDAKKV